MQISPLKTNTLRSSAATAAAAGTALAGKAGATGAAGTSVLSSGLRRMDPGLNQEISNAQKILRFLDESESQLQSLKADISSKLGARQGGDDKLEARLRQFEAHWQERQAASGGSLDWQLNYTRGEKSRQSFTIAGLDLRALQGGAREKLDFSVNGNTAQTVSATMEPDLPAQEVARRLDQALAPLDIRAALGKDGKLSFSTPEELWPRVRDALTVKGNGVRVAGGRPHRVKAEPSPDAVRPADWRGDNAAEMRNTLQEVVNTLNWVQRARQAVNQALTEMQRALSASSAAATGNESQGAAESAESKWAAEFAKEFDAMAQQSHYQMFYAVAPALSSVSRARVQALLALP